VSTDDRDPGHGPVDLRASRAKNLLFGVLALGFAGISLYVTSTNAGAWFGVVFFGLIAVGLFLSVRPDASGMTLTDEGFTLRSLIGENTTPWSEVAKFDIGRLPGKGAVAGIRYRPDAPERKGRRVAKGMGGGLDGALPENYGLEPQDLVDLMERWRAAHGGRPARS
jgi:hypothetical protein